MRLLTLDLETAPNIAHVWGLWQQNVAINQLVQSGSVISFAAKWYGKSKVEFYSDHHDGHDEMVKQAHRLLDEADMVCHYNGNSFDMPWLRTEFAQAGLTPPSPWRDIDLLRAVKKAFRFPSNKLQYVSTALGLEGKFQHSGHDLWTRCMAGDDKAWAIMRRYNKQDVVLTEKLYDRLKPWINPIPNAGLYVDDDNPVCPTPGCGSTKLQRRGFAVTSVSKYQRWQCGSCGRWAKGRSRVSGVELRPA